MSSAGHPPPIIIHDDGAVREAGRPGPLLGGWESSSWEDRVVELSPRETMLMYTDGVTDARGEDDHFGLARLYDVLTAAAGAAPSGLLDQLEAVLDGYQVDRQSDDTAAVALRPTGAEATSGAPATLASGCP
jgi:serine phosphatase RsbU (regulator of sigma subunit)